MPDAPKPSPLVTLGALVRLTLAFSSPPSIRRLADEVGLSVHAVHNHLIALERQGLAGRSSESAGKMVRWSATRDGHAAALNGVDTCTHKRRLRRCYDSGELVACDGAVA